jgi:hypothetical protein
MLYAIDKLNNGTKVYISGTKGLWAEDVMVSDNNVVFKYPID